MRPPPRSAAMGQVQDEACREVDGLPGDPPLGDDADGRGDEAPVRPARVGTPVAQGHRPVIRAGTPITAGAAR